MPTPVTLDTVILRGCNPSCSRSITTTTCDGHNEENSPYRRVRWTTCIDRSPELVGVVDEHDDDG